MTLTNIASNVSNNAVTLINLQVRYYSNKSVVSFHSQHVFTAATIIIVFINKNMF